MSILRTDSIKKKINIVGEEVRDVIDVAAVVGKEVGKTTVTLAVCTGKIACETGKTLYDAVGGTEGIQRGVKTAGIITTEALKIGGTVVVTVGAITIKVIRHMAKEIGSAITEQLEDRTEYVDFVVQDDD